MHKQASIMFTDIQGYTAMMQKDEDYAIGIRKRHRDVFQATTEKHKGIILQYYGDGTLSIFNSPLDAVQCGIDLQLTYQQKPHIPVRIGIHYGEITYDKKDVVGDGVALANSIESLSFSGGVLISDTLKNKLPADLIQTSSIGKFKLNNETELVEVFAVNHPDLATPDNKNVPDKKLKKKLLNPLILKVILFALLLSIIAFFIHTRITRHSELVDLYDKSVAVLPFVNMSDDPFQEYFSDGVTEEIINHLSEIRDLKVISKTSIMKYKNSEKSIKVVSQELGVSNILEGSLRKDGDQIRIVAKLINVETDSYLWTKTYNGKKSDIFSLEIDLALDIVRVLKAHYTDTELEQIEQEPTKSFTAFDSYLKGINQYESYSIEGYNESVRLFQETIKMDPDFDAAYARLALSYIYQASWAGDVRPDEVQTKAISFANKALELNPDQHLAHNAKALIYFWFDWNFEEAEKSFRRSQEALSMGANSIHFQQFLINMGRFEESLELGQRSLKTDPLHFGIYLETGLSLFFMKRYSEAEKTLKEGIRLNPTVMDLYNKLGKLYLNTGKYEEAVLKLEEGLNLNSLRPPSMLVYLAIARSKQGDQQVIPNTIKELKDRRTSGEKGIAYFLAHMYSAMEDQELTLLWLETAYEEHEVELIWLKVEPQFENLHEEPRFKKILNAIGFPK